MQIREKHPKAFGRGSLWGQMKPGSGTSSLNHGVSHAPSLSLGMGWRNNGCWVSGLPLDQVAEKNSRIAHREATAFCFVRHLDVFIKDEPIWTRPTGGGDVDVFKETVTSNRNFGRPSHLLRRVLKGQMDRKD